MKTINLKDLVSLMNIYDVEVGSASIDSLIPPRKLNMKSLETDPVMIQFGERKVESITNIAHLGITIWIE